MNNYLQELGKTVYRQIPEESVDEFDNGLNEVKSKRDEVKQKIELITKAEKKFENQIIEKALNQLRVFETFLESMVDYAVSLSHVKFSTNYNLQKGINRKTKEKLSNHEKEHLEKLSKSYRGLYQRIIIELEDTKMIEIIEPKEGTMLDEKDDDIQAIGGGIYHPDLSKEGLIVEVHNPAFKMGNRLIKPAEVVVYTNSKQATMRYDER